MREENSVAQQQEDIEKRELYGVSGWLLWFCIVLAVLNPIISLVEGGVWLTSPLGLLVLTTVIGVLAGVKIWRKNISGFKWLTTYLVLVIGLCVFLFVFVMANAQGTPNSDAAVAITRPAVGAIIVASYFHKSKRVRQTFGRNL